MCVCLDAGDKELFVNLKPVLGQSLGQEPIEWRRQYGRPVKMVTLSTEFIPFDKDTVAELIGSQKLVGRPIMHTFWTQCLVRHIIIIVVDCSAVLLHYFKQQNIANQWRTFNLGRGLKNYILKKISMPLVITASTLIKFFKSLNNT